MTDPTAKTVDWRLKLRINTRKTYIVISLFFMIYIAFGFLFDYILYIIFYPYLNFFEFLHAIKTFHIIPHFTIIMLGIAILNLLFTMISPMNFILIGTNYISLNNLSHKSNEEVLLENIVGEMAIAASIPTPAIYILPREDINAFSSGFEIESSFIVVTQGVLHKLNRTEIEGIIAHEMTHIKCLDIRLSLIVTTFTKWMNLFINSIFNLTIYFAKGLMDNVGDDRQSMQTATAKAIWLLLAIFFLWPLLITIIILKIILYPITSVLTLYLDRTREIYADTGAIQLLRMNEGLGKALITVEKDYQINIFMYQKYIYSSYENLRFDLYFYDPRLLLDKNQLFFYGQPSISQRLKNIGINH